MFTRRNLFELGAGVAVTALATQTATAGRFDLTAPSTSLIWKKALYDETVLQSFAFDNVNKHIYAVQVKNGSGSAAAGHLCLTKLSLSGGVLGHMYLMGFGHGVQIGVEPGGWLWTETNAVTGGANAWGNRLARFRFAGGTTLTASSSALTKYDLIPGATATTCTIDPSTNRLVMRYLLGGVRRYAVYTLSSVKAGAPKKLFDVAQPAGLGTFQGYAAYGRYLYLLEGTAYSASNPAPTGNTFITSVDLETGAKVQRARTQAGKSLDFREPEGMGVQIVSGAPRLCLGLASGAAGARKVSIFYKDRLV